MRFLNKLLQIVLIGTATLPGIVRSAGTDDYSSVKEVNELALNFIGQILAALGPEGVTFVNLLTLLFVVTILSISLVGLIGQLYDRFGLFSSLFGGKKPPKRKK